MAQRIAIRITVDETLDLEPLPEWRPHSSLPYRDELHVSIGPLHLVLTEVVAVALSQQLEALIRRKLQP